MRSKRSSPCATRGAVKSEESSEMDQSQESTRVGKQSPRPGKINEKLITEDRTSVQAEHVSPSPVTAQKKVVTADILQGDSIAVSDDLRAIQSASKARSTKTTNLHRGTLGWNNCLRQTAVRA
jgi:hypothetical protein